MGVGSFKKPENGPKVGGPKVGEVVDYSKLPPERKEALGDLDALKIETPEPQLAPEDAVRAQQGAEQLEALKAVIEREEAAPDPAEIAETRLQELAEPTVEDRREFLRCLLGNGIYEKRYEMFGGMLVMTLHDIAPGLEDVIFTTLANELREGHIETDDDWTLMLDRLRLVTNVSSIRLSNGAPIACRVEHGAGLLPLVEERLKLFPSTALYRAALQTVRVFMRHMELMLDRALDSDFWEAGGHDSPYAPMSAEPSDTETTLP